jgi:hypothetical protein
LPRARPANTAFQVPRPRSRSRHEDPNGRLHEMGATASSTSTGFRPCSSASPLGRFGSSASPTIREE